MSGIFKTVATVMKAKAQMGTCPMNDLRTVSMPYLKVA